MIGSVNQQIITDEFYYLMNMLNFLYFKVQSMNPRSNLSLLDFHLSQTKNYEKIEQFLSTSKFVKNLPFSHAA